MNKNFAITSLLTIILSTLTMSAQPDWRAGSEWNMTNYPSEAEIYQEVDFLCSELMEGRERGTAGHANAAAYIIGSLKNYGCTSMNDGYTHSFMVTDSTDLGHNVLGIMHCGSTNPAAGYIIVGAHYDGIGTIDGVLYPGADANASGVAAMLEAANFMHAQLREGYTYGSNIIFVAFDSFGDGREGSRQLWQAIRNGKITDTATGRKIRSTDIKAMIDLDQVGSSLAPIHTNRRDYLIAIGESTLASAASKNLLNRCNEFYRTNLDLDSTYYGSASFTDAFYKLGDRKHFIRSGIPTIYFTSGIAPTTNKPDDTAESLDYEVLRKRIILISRYIEKIL